MNWRKIDEEWRGFAESQNCQIVYDEKTYLYGSKCTYKIRIPSNTFEICFTGIATKQNQGYSTFKTEISASIPSSTLVSLKDVEDRRFLFFKRNYSDFLSNEILGILRKHKANKLRFVNKSNLIVEFDRTFNESIDFQNGQELIAEIYDRILSKH